MGTPRHGHLSPRPRLHFTEVATHQQMLHILQLLVYGDRYDTTECPRRFVRHIHQLSERFKLLNTFVRLLGSSSRHHNLDNLHSHRRWNFRLWESDNRFKDLASPRRASCPVDMYNLYACWYLIHGITVRKIWYHARWKRSGTQRFEGRTLRHWWN